MDTDTEHGKIDLSKLAERADKYVEEGVQFGELLEAKRNLCALVDCHAAELCLTDDIDSKFLNNRFLVTVFEFLRELVIRDDSLFVLSGTDAISEALAWVAEAVSLREQVEAYPAETIPKDFQDGVQRLKNAQDEYLARCVALGTNDPNPIRIWSGSSARFLKYGRILEFSNRQVSDFFCNSTRPMYYVDGKFTGIRLGEEGVYEAGRIVFPKREPSIYMQDYHSGTSELLVPDGPVIMQVVHPDEDREDYFNGELFYIPRGVPLFLKKEIRHFAPLPLDRGMVTSPVVFRLATTTDQKDFHHHVFCLQRRIL